jgi:hypothetical protein
MNTQQQYTTVSILYLHAQYTHVTKTKRTNLTHKLISITYCVELYCEIIRNVIVFK